MRISNFQLSRAFIVFIGVGLLSAFVDLTLFVFLLLVGINYILAATFAFFIGFAVNYAGHTKITFSSEFNIYRFVRFSIVVMFNFVITLLCIEISQYFFEIPLPGKIISLPVVAVTGYFLSKYWIFDD